jgi:hypothetical protein
VKCSDARDLYSASVLGLELVSVLLVVVAVIFLFLCGNFCFVFHSLIE